MASEAVTRRSRRLLVRGSWQKFEVYLDARCSEPDPPLPARGGDESCLIEQVRIGLKFDRVRFRQALA